jgi:hypothetical protein
MIIFLSACLKFVDAEGWKRKENKVTEKPNILNRLITFGYFFSTNLILHHLLNSNFFKAQ